MTTNTNAITLFNFWTKSKYPERKKPNDNKTAYLIWDIKIDKSRFDPVFFLGLIKSYLTKNKTSTLAHKEHKKNVNTDFHSFAFSGSDVPITRGKIKRGSFILKLFRPFERLFVKINQINSIRKIDNNPTSIY